MQYRKLKVGLSLASSVLIRSVTIVVGFLILSILSSSVSAQTPGYAVLSTPFCTRLGIFRVIEISAVGSSQGSNQIIILGVFLNSTTGRILEVTTATATITEGENLTLYLVLNLPFGNYSTIVFPFSTFGQQFPPTYSISC